MISFLFRDWPRRSLPCLHIFSLADLVVRLSEHFFENPEELTEAPGGCCLCSSRQVCAKCIRWQLPRGFLGSPLPSVAAHSHPVPVRLAPAPGVSVELSGL